MKISPALQHALQHHHETIGEMVSGLAPEKLTQQPEPGKWSIHQQITHLAAYQPVFAERIELIIKENNPVFGRYLAENDPHFAVSEKKSTEELLQILAWDRRVISERILALTEKDLQRIGIHPLFGNMTIIDWTRFFVMHEGHHIFAIFKLHKSV